MIIFSPLEQFEVYCIVPIKFGAIDFSFTIGSLYLCFIMFFVVLVCILNCNLLLIPVSGQVLFEFFYKFLFGILSQQASMQGIFLFPLLVTTFLFIFLSNYIGLIGFSFTPTSHILITFILAFSFNLYFIYIGLEQHKIKFLKLFVPTGISVFILPLIVLIEVFSYLIRTVSLSVRLFANMLAGHTLLHIFATFVYILLHTTNLKLIAIVPFLFLFFIFILEIGIAFLQSYVFTLLLCIYLGNSLYPAH